jgi:hypothetical protein
MFLGAVCRFLWILLISHSFFLAIVDLFDSLSV